jgi:hypothetical protein
LAKRRYRIIVEFSSGNIAVDDVCGKIAPQNSMI